MRYSRQEVLEKIGKKGQEVLNKSTVTIVGVGALGSVAADLLARAGIGRLVLIDRDVVELTNLQRQSLYTEDDIGKPKALQAQVHLKKINSETKIDVHTEDLTEKNADLLRKGNLILDGTDNFETRFLINDWCKKIRVPWVYGAAIQEKGFVMPILPEGACFSCVFNNAKTTETCDAVGVLNTITHLVACLQVSEALKILLHEPIEQHLLSINIWDNQLNKINVKKRKDCKVCQGTYEYLHGKKSSTMIRFCGSGTYQFSYEERDLADVEKMLRKSERVTGLGTCLQVKNMTIFKNRVLIKAQSEAEARSAFSKYFGN